MFWSLAAEVAEMRGVKSHKPEMVRKMVVGMGEAIGALEGGRVGLRVFTSVLQQVPDGGDLDEEEDGYCSSSKEEGPPRRRWRHGGWGRRFVSS